MVFAASNSGSCWSNCLCVKQILLLFTLQLPPPSLGLLRSSSSLFHRFPPSQLYSLLFPPSLPILPLLSAADWQHHSCCRSCHHHQPNWHVSNVLFLMWCPKFPTFFVSVVLFTIQCWISVNFHSHSPRRGAVHFLNLELRNYWEVHSSSNLFHLFSPWINLLKLFYVKENSHKVLHITWVHWYKNIQIGTFISIQNILVVALDWV